MNRDALRTQMLYLFIGFVITMVVCGIVTYSVTDFTKTSLRQIAKVDLPGDSINAHEIWTNKIEEEKKLLEQRVRFLESVVLDLTKKSEEKAFVVEKRVLNEEEKLDKKENEEEKVLQTTKSIGAFKKNWSDTIAFSGFDDPFISPYENNISESSPVFKEVVMGRAKRVVSHIDSEIPAGATVRAILVSSVDAPCGVKAGHDPHPVKLRLIDDGHLPKGLKAQLKGGLIIASAYGDLSSERVYMRLERLSLFKENGEFVETSVTGFVTGCDGKFGVRGDVVDKSAKIVANAARSGAMSGISNILQTSLAKHSVNQYSFDVVKDGCANGASTAFDMLADYYLQRAEQVNPVIQIAAGQEVDITFTHQAVIGDLHTKENVKKIREISRREDG